jgi:Leu/Phe-tRNA-protein transferase
MSPPAPDEEALSSQQAGRPLEGTQTAALGSQWCNLPKERVVQLITAQIPRFRTRPYLADARALVDALANGLATHLSGDFCWSLNFSASFVAALCYEGLLPICCELGGGTGLYVLLPKLHAERCVLSFDALHIPKKVRKRARRHVLTCGQAFDAVLDGCLRQHGESWLYPPLRRALCELAGPEHAVALASARDADAAVAHAPRFALPSAPLRPSASRRGGTARATPGADGGGAGVVRMCSFELWREGRLVAGEIGCAVGCSYTSFSGFHAEPSAGSVQQALTARLLARAGFCHWDLGQEHAYKLAMGAVMVPRADFLGRLHAARCSGSRLEQVLRECGHRVTHEVLDGAAAAGADAPCTVEVLEIP